MIMNAEIGKSIEICIDGIDGKAGEEGDLFVLKTLERLDKEPYRGRRLGIGGTGANEYRASWADMIKRFVGWKERISGQLDWEDALLMLFDWANLDEDAIFGYAQKIEDAIIYNHVLKHIIENLVRLSDIERALAFTLKFRPTHIFKDEDNLYMGYRIIAGHHARRGESVEFFRLFKRCAPSSERYEMGLLKAELVEGVCRKDGIEAALAVCGHKSIGEKYYFNALRVYAESGEYAKLKEIFAEYPQLKQPESETELNILAAACREARGKGTPVDDDFEELFKRAIEVTSKLKWGDMRLRDSILLDLGMAYHDDKERKTRCRKAIRNNWVKKELNG
jgi:hypothetical protein